MSEEKDDKRQRQDPAPEPELLGIEELAARHALGPGAFAGLKAHCGWAAGKMVTEKAFLAELAAFRSASILGVK